VTEHDHATHQDGCCHGQGCGSKGTVVDTDAITDPKYLPQSSQRRTFLKVLVGVFAVIWAGMTTFPLLRYLGSGSRLQENTQQVTSVSVGKASDFPPGSSKNFQFGSQPALLIALADGSYAAYNAVCTHLGCTVQYEQPKNSISCACHGGQYDPATGKNVSGPPPKPLALLKAEVVKGDIIVSKA
jgi:cytochrome b6-f complex iron-sulfur subunit